MKMKSFGPTALRPLVLVPFLAIFAGCTAAQDDRSTVESEDQLRAGEWQGSECYAAFSSKGRSYNIQFDNHPNGPQTVYITNDNAGSVSVTLQRKDGKPFFFRTEKNIAIDTSDLVVASGPRKGEGGFRIQFQTIKPSNPNTTARDVA